MSGITFNPLHTMADVTTPDGALIGAVPATRQGVAAAEDALTAYRCAAPDTPETVALRLRVARRIIVQAGGTPAPARRPEEIWESAVWGHQKALKRDGCGEPCWTLGLDDAQEARRAVGE